jgi:hypothetical protein
MFKSVRFIVAAANNNFVAASGFLTQPHPSIANPTPDHPPKRRSIRQFVWKNWDRQRLKLNRARPMIAGALREMYPFRVA